MQSKILIPVILLLVLVGGVLYFTSSAKQDDTIRSGNTVNSIDNTSQLASDEVPPTSTAILPAERLTESNYLTYSEELARSLASRSQNTVVLFFHATWCPTCRNAEKDVKENMQQLIDNNIFILTVDFDTAIELRRTYKVTVQHTFIHIDSDLEEISKWSGGGVTEILNNI